MYKLEEIGYAAGSSANAHAITSELVIDSPWCYDVEVQLECIAEDVVYIYRLIEDESSNMELDKMICEELSIEPSSFTDDYNHIHFLEVGANIWSTDQPEVVLYYGNEIVDSYKLKKKIARALTTSPVEVHFCMESRPLSEHDFLSYAMRLILAEEANT